MEVFVVVIASLIYENHIKRKGRLLLIRKWSIFVVVSTIPVFFAGYQKFLSEPPEQEPILNFCSSNLNLIWSTLKTIEFCFTVRYMKHKLTISLNRCILILTFEEVYIHVVSGSAWIFTFLSSWKMLEANFSPWCLVF